MLKEIIDTTLRDGEQAPGVSFTEKEKKEIALGLIDIGINEIEAGIPIMGKNSINFIKWLSKESHTTKIASWCRLNIKDLIAAKKTGADIIHISIPISKYHLEGQMGNWSNVMNKLTEYICFAKDNFKFVSLGLQDSFRSEGKRLKEVCEFAQENKLYRVRFSDTVGNALPLEVKKMILTYKNHFSGKIDFHGHNDFGLGTANALTALESGADSVNVTVNGLGERAGNTALEEIVFILDMHKSLCSNINVKKIKKLCELVACYSKRTIPLNKPIIGEMAFIHESGIHSHGIQKNSLAYQPFEPEEKGLPPTKIVVGSHSGKSNVLNILNNEGIKYSEELIPDVITKLKEKALIKKNYLTTEEVINIYKQEIGELL